MKTTNVMAIGLAALLLGLNLVSKAPAERSLSSVQVLEPSHGPAELLMIEEASQASPAEVLMALDADKKEESKPKECASAKLEKSTRKLVNKNNVREVVRVVEKIVPQENGQMKEMMAMMMSQMMITNNLMLAMMKDREEMNRFVNFNRQEVLAPTERFSNHLNYLSQKQDYYPTEKFSYFTLERQNAIFPSFRL